MTQTSFELDAESPESAPFACPNCSEPLSVEPIECRHCEFEAAIRNGIFSLLPRSSARADRTDESATVEELERLAMRTERMSVREASDGFRSRDRSSLLSELYDVGRDAWRVFAAEHITGRCLDLNAGFGRRSMLLAELAETVYAVDPCLSKLRVAVARDDYESSDRVVPVHTTADRLPFETESFDTIVADFTGLNPRELVSRIERLESLLADGGTVIFLADGATSRLGLPSAVGMDAPETRDGIDLSGAIRGTPDGYRSLLSDATADFSDVSTYALFPTATRPLYVFDVENRRAVRKLSEMVFSEQGRLAQFAKPFVSLSERSGLLKRLYPHYLIVCTNDPSPPPFDASNPLLLSGRARSVLLELADDGTEAVWKIPNKNSNAPLTEREHSVISHLEGTDETITETLPTGNALDSPFGVVRTEQSVEGRPLLEDLDGSVESFESVLDHGFEWLIDFQQRFRSESIVRSPADVRNDLRFEPTGITPPPIDDPVETFFTPVHGDFIAANIHVSDGEITGVIDWEYGALEASPIIDAGFFVLNAATETFGSFEAGFQGVFCEDNAYARVARTYVRRYCDELGLPYRTFKLYLPSVYLHRLETDWKLNASTTYTNRLYGRTRFVECVFEHLDSVRLS